jgi:hypothetical protein
MNTRHLLIVGRALFFLGVVIGFARSVISIWNNLEATDYYFTGATHAPFKGLRCPMMIAPTEKGNVTVVFNNPTKEEDNFFYRVEISGKAFSTREIEGQIAVPPRQAKDIQFKVDTHDVDLLFFILVKITMLPNSVHSTQDATCGIMVVNILGLTGSQVSLATLILSITGILIGLFLWEGTNSKVNGNRPRIVQFLGLVVLLSLLATYMGWWAVATVLAVIIILLVIISLRFAFA